MNQAEQNEQGQGLQSPFRIHTPESPVGLSDIEQEIFHLLAPRVIVFNQPPQKRAQQSQDRQDK